jgi:hypothetical protein
MGFYASAVMIFHLFISSGVYTLQKRHFEKDLGETIHPLPKFSQTSRSSKIIPTRQSTPPFFFVALYFKTLPHNDSYLVT